MIESAIVILPSPRRGCFPGKLSAPFRTNCRAALNSSSLPWNKARRREDKSWVIIDTSRAFCRSSLVSMNLSKLCDPMRSGRELNAKRLANQHDSGGDLVVEDRDRGLADRGSPRRDDPRRQIAGLRDKAQTALVVANVARRAPRAVAAP